MIEIGINDVQLAESDEANFRDDSGIEGCGTMDSQRFETETVAVPP